MLLAMSCMQWKAATTDCSVGEDIFWGVAQKVMIYVAVKLHICPMCTKGN